MNANHDYLSPAAVNPAVRIGVLVSEAHSLATFSRRGFFVRCTRQVLWAGRVGRGNPRRPSDRYANLHGLPTPIGVGVSGKRNRFLRTTAMPKAQPARSRKPKLPKFQPVFTEDQVRQIEADYNEEWGVRRRLVMITLARTAAQLAEGFRDIEGEAFSELLGHFNDFKAHCKAGMELAESAEARMLAVGMYIVETSEAEAQHA